jgi:membrane protein implicated in regulation of membrane protease activity
MAALVMLAVESGHSGVAHPLTGFALSDVALFVIAVVAVWQVRRALRKRFAKTRAPAKPPFKKD